jgi:hypothetical protein
MTEALRVKQSSPAVVSRSAVCDGPGAETSVIDYGILPQFRSWVLRFRGVWIREFVRKLFPASLRAMPTILVRRLIREAFGV